MSGSFDDFLSNLLAFESGWDRVRYDAGIIQDWQLDQWAGGTVETFFPDYASWSQLSDAEWTGMAYRSMNTYGFVGYQFGEALLIDLGYYDDDFYYGNGAATNTWDGVWTGKNGVDSLDAFMTAEAQDVAIREAFGHNLGIIETGLAAAGKSLDDFLGATLSYGQNGEQVAVTLTLTGILAGAHLRGAPAVVELLLNNTVSADEYGTSILQYIAQFGGFDAPAIPALVAYFEDRLTGDEGLGTPGDTDVASGNGGADVTADTADVVITWAWGQDAVIAGFDPAADTIYLDWFSAGDVRIVEIDGSTVFQIDGNNQSTTIEGVSLAALSAANFTIEDDGLAGKILALIGADGSSGEGGGGASAGDPASVNGSTGVTAAEATVVITWTWGQDPLVDGFDPAHDTIFIDWFHAGEVEIYEAGGNVVFAVPGNNQSTTLTDLSLTDLSPANFTIRDGELGAEILGAIGSAGAAGSDGGGGSADTGGSDGGEVAGDPDAGAGGAQPNGAVDVFRLGWDWGATETIADFVASEDVLDFGSLPATLVAIAEVDGSLTIEVLDNGGHMYVLEGVQAEDLTAANLSAPAWNGVLVAAHGVLDQLAALGNQDIALA